MIKILSIKALRLPQFANIDSLNFSFKCHRDTGTAPGSRDTVKVYAVNSIAFHPVFGTFSTAGADGTFHFWLKLFAS